MTGRRRGRYPPEYEERLVGLVRSGRSPGAPAREFDAERAAATETDYGIG